MDSVVQRAIEQSVLNVAKHLEDQLDQQIHKLENLDDDDLERVRQRRIGELKKQQERTRQWLANGHGEYRELGNEKDFFKEIKGEERVICHFYRESWPCKVSPHSCEHFRTHKHTRKLTLAALAPIAYGQHS